jgi:hypothetical protein
MVEAPLGPVLSRTERRAEKAKSSAALVGLGGLFLVTGLGAIGALAILKRKDDMVLEDAFGVLPQHLEEGSPDMLRAAEEPDTAPLAAHMLEHAPPVVLPPESPAVPPPVPASEEPEPVAANGNGNGAGSTFHREQVEAELQQVLAEAGIDTEVATILADAREWAEREGIEVDSDLMLQVLCDELGGASLSESRREDLLSMFRTIAAEEAAHVPQQAS